MPYGRRPTLPLVKDTFFVLASLGEGETWYFWIRSTYHCQASRPPASARRDFFLSGSNICAEVGPVEPAPAAHRISSGPNHRPSTAKMPNWFLSGLVSFRAASSTSSSVQVSAGSFNPASWKRFLL